MNRTFQNTLKRWSLGAVLLAGGIVILSLLAPAFSPPTQAPGIPTSPPETGQALPTSPQPEIVGDFTTSTAALVTPTPSPTGNPQAQTICTYNRYYWLSHPEAWPTENFIIDRVSYTKAEALAILASDSADITSLLLQQFFPAVMNTLQGADSRPIDSTLYAAGQWLSQHPYGVPVPPEDSPNAVTLTLELEAYNLGALGPWACPDQPSTPTVMPMDTPTLTATLTATARSYQPPPPTSRPERSPQPTKAPTKTSLPQPSDTPQPPPTATKPPTQPPPPTPRATATTRPTPTLVSPTQQP